LAEIDQGLVARIAEKRGREVAEAVLALLEALAADPMQEVPAELLGLDDCSEEILRLGVQHGLDAYELAKTVGLDTRPKTTGRISRREVPIDEASK
jgi:hypothetical protein